MRRVGSRQHLHYRRTRTAQCYCTMRLNVAVWVIAFEPAPDIAVIVMG
jgi:hypothetical protein